MLSIKPQWYRNRGYLHFDCPIGYKKATSVVTNPNIVARHAFYPLISYVVESKKIKKCSASNKMDVIKKNRPIAYSSHLDSHIYSYYAKILLARYEERLQELGLSDTVLAFRGLGKSNIDFAYDAFEKIKSMGECSAVALDFSKFFDTLDHQILKDSWASILGCQSLPSDHFNVYKSLTNFSQVEKLSLYARFNISKHNPKNGRVRVCTAKEFREVVRKEGLIYTNRAGIGIPQGSPMSALLSNIYMLNFDMEMKKYVEIFGGEYFRYCDDMLFVVPLQLKDKVAGFAQKNIKALKVTLNTKKTELRTFKIVGGRLRSDKMLQYLGFTFDGENIFIRSSSLARYSEKMKRSVRLAKNTMQKYNSIRVNKGLPEEPLYLKKLYSRYTHLGGRNFITYGLRAAEKMKSKSIKRQLKPLWRRFNEELSKS